MRYVDTIAGGGKTHAAVDYACQRASQMKFIIAQPSQHLVSQTFADIQKRYENVRVTAIHSGTDPKRVTSAIINEMKIAQSRKDGEELLVTHAALERLPTAVKDIFGPFWNLIVDEVPSATGQHRYADLPIGVRASLDAYDGGLEYYRLVPSNWALWKRIASGKVYSARMGEFKDVGADLLNPHKTVYVRKAQWAAAGSPNALVSFFTLLQPTIMDGFAGEATIMSACFHDTLLYRLWRIGGVEFEPHKGITSKVRSTEHLNGNLLTLYYAVERDWSKRMRYEEATPGSGVSVLQAMRSAVGKLFAGQDHVYLVNKDAEDEVKGTGLKLPNSPYGLNEFDGYDNAAIYSSLNLRPDHIKFLASRGISSDEIRGAISYQATYQAALRTSLRDIHSTTPKQVVVQDRGCADYIAALLPGCLVKKLDSEIAGRTKQTSKGRGRDVLPADRVRAFREERMLRQAVGVALVNGLKNEVPDAVFNGVAEKGVHTLKSTPCVRKTPLVGMSIFDKKYCDKPLCLIQWQGPDQFIDELRGFAAMRHASKADNWLISPSIFDPHQAVDANYLNSHGKPKKRGRINVVSSIGIWLDFDGGDMTVDQLLRIFPDRKRCAAALGMAA